MLKNQASNTDNISIVVELRHDSHSFVPQSFCGTAKAFYPFQRVDMLIGSLNSLLWLKRNMTAPWGETKLCTESHLWHLWVTEELLCTSISYLSDVI